MPPTFHSSRLEWLSEAACMSKYPAICKAVIYVDSVEKKKKITVFHYPGSSIHPPLTSELSVNK